MTLSDRIAALSAPDRAIDVLCEIALFTPYGRWASIHPHPSGDKLIAVQNDGETQTMWPDAWTKCIGPTVAALREKGL